MLVSVALWQWHEGKVPKYQNRDFTNTHPHDTPNIKIRKSSINFLCEIVSTIWYSGSVGARRNSSVRQGRATLLIIWPVLIDVTRGYLG